MLQEVKERSTAYLTASFLDRNNSPAAPTSGTYRIDCLTTGTQIVGDTALPAGSAPEIVLTPTINRIIQSGNVREKRRVTVRGVYGSGDEVNDKYEYYVVNLSGVT